MTRKGPLITLLGGGALAAVLLAASVSAATGGNDYPDLAGGEAPPTEAPDEPEATEPPEEPEEPEEDPEPVTYVGYVDGGGASVAIIITGDDATAYVCNGRQIEAWLGGPATNGELVLSGENGTLVGSYDDAAATGETTVESIDWTFTIEKVDLPEGLFRFASTVVGGAEVEGAWIILPDGTQIGQLWVDGEPSGTLDPDNPAPQIDPETGQVEVNGQTIFAERVG